MAQVDKLKAINPAALEEAQAAIPPENLLNDVVRTFQALGDSTRARILYALVKRPLCVRDLAILAGVSQSAISHQLRYLRDQRLLKTRREGNVIYYMLSDPHLSALFREAEHHVDHIYQNLPDHPYGD